MQVAGTEMGLKGQDKGFRGMDQGYILTMKGMIQNLDNEIQKLEKMSETDFQTLLHENEAHFNKVDELSFIVNLRSYLDSLNLSKSQKNILQVGFDTGHVTLLFLLSNNQSIVTVYDNFSTSYSQSCFKLDISNFFSSHNINCLNLNSIGSSGFNDGV